MARKELVKLAKVNVGGLFRYCGALYIKLGNKNLYKPNAQRVDNNKTTSINGNTMVEAL